MHGDVGDRERIIALYGYRVRYCDADQLPLHLFLPRMTEQVAR